MDITNKLMQYNLNMAESETIEIKINGVVVFSESVTIGFKSAITFMYQEQIVPQT